MGKEIRDILKEKMRGALDLVCSQNPVNMQYIAFFLAYVLQTDLFFCLLVFGYPYGGQNAARRELSMPFYT